MGIMSRKQEAGSRNKLIILHGWSYSMEKWAPFLELLEEKGVKLRLLEIPGLTAPIERPWTLDDYVKWLKNKVGEEKTILIGHSNGGRISLSFALKYPKLVERLILIDSGGIRHNEWYIRLKRSTFMFLSKIGKKVVNHSLARDLIYKLAGVSDYKEAGSLMRQTMVNLISIDLTPELHKVSVPTLIIWGKEDRITPLKDAKLMYELIPNSRIHIIKGARHSPQFTHPEKVCEKIWQFLTR